MRSISDISVSQETTHTALSGRVVALPETRELDLLVQLLQQQGARTLRCPLVGLLDAPDQEAIRQWLHELMSERLDDVIFLTGEGILRLRSAADRWGWSTLFPRALGQVRKITRGPKPARALLTLGLRPEVAATVPTTDGVITAMRSLNLQGRTVGIQLYGQDPHQRLIDFLVEAGATPRPVISYTYASASEDEKVLDLITRLAMGQVDVIAFTSAGQVKRLNDVAAAYGQEPALRAGLERTTIAAVGPVVTDELERRGLTTETRPARNYFMKSLVQQIIAILRQQTPPTEPHPHD